MRKTTDWVPSLWRDTFEETLSEDSELVCGGQWSLNFNYRQTEELTNEERRRGWKICICNAHANFKCGSCSNIWFSAKAKLMFRYRLRGARGTVVMRPLGQACRCNDGAFYYPGFSSEVIERALLRVFAKIRKNCYRVEEEPTDVGDVLPKRRTKPHETALCEACQLGICTEMDN